MAKTSLTSVAEKFWGGRLQRREPLPFALRFPVVSASAAFGNVCSSFAFVPKELIKQRIQVRTFVAVCSAAL